MYRVSLPQLGFFEAWRDAARRLLTHAVPPDQVEWGRGDDASLFPAEPLPNTDGPEQVTTTKDFVSLAKTALCHSGIEAATLLYQALHRHQSDRRALSNPADAIGRKLSMLQKAVRRDIHKMHAFVRFRELPPNGERRSFGAWFEPDHSILETGTPFFAKRFADMDWMIATPQGVSQFEQGKLSFHPPAARPDLPEDASEALWGTYFANIFNPARLHLQAMRSEMPLKYWKNLPETQLIPGMLADAEARVARMRAAMPTKTPARAERILSRLPQAEVADVPTTMDEARIAAMQCQRCGLCEAATQTVWGRGDAQSDLMIVGEQPGDAEDLSGKPFVGPAGKLLTSLMEEAGTGPSWMTNAVKHFKFRPTGKRRLHQNPNRGEIDHCRWWLDLERRLVQPKLTVALGASAAYALTGDVGALRPRRGGVEDAHDGGAVLITYHPSYILRLTGEAAANARSELVQDLKRATALLEVPKASVAP